MRDPLDSWDKKYRFLFLRQRCKQINFEMLRFSR